MAKNVLAEAIADAKILKETAIANAKISLEETFTPTIQRLVSSKIQEEDEDDQDIDIDLDVEEQPSADSTGFESFEDEPEPSEENDEMELEALMRELDGEDEEMSESDEFDDEMTESDDEQMEEGEEESWSDPIDENEEMDYTEDELEEALKVMFEEDGLGDDLDMGPEKEDGDSFTENPPTGPQFLERRKLKNENKQLKAKLNQVQTKLNESLKANIAYKKVLNEVNLLNAKLMYNTKALRQFELSESQQQRILDSFDRANTVREVKLVYTTICEAFNKKPITKKITEGSASKTIKQISPNKQKLNEDYQQIVRWSPDRLQQLANIKKTDY